MTLVIHRGLKELLNLGFISGKVVNLRKTGLHERLFNANNYK